MISITASELTSTGMRTVCSVARPDDASDLWYGAWLPTTNSTMPLLVVAKMPTSRIHQPPMSAGMVASIQNWQGLTLST